MPKPIREHKFTPIATVTEYDDGSYALDIDWGGSYHQSMSLDGLPIPDTDTGHYEPGERASFWLDKHLANKEA